MPEYGASRRSSLPLPNPHLGISSELHLPAPMLGFLTLQPLAPAKQPAPKPGFLTLQPLAPPEQPPGFLTLQPLAPPEQSYTTANPFHLPRYLVYYIYL